MLPNPAGKLAVCIELLKSTPSTPIKVNVSCKAKCSCLPTD